MVDKIDGIIEEVCSPYFNEKYGYFICRIKVSGKWQNVWRRKETRINELFNTLRKRSNEQKLELSSKITHLNKDELRECERSVEVLKNSYECENIPTHIVLRDAIEFFIKHTPSLKPPFVEECVELFLKQRVEFGLAQITIDHYGIFFNKFMDEFRGFRINEIERVMLREFLEGQSDNAKMTMTIQLKSFFNFCAGKNNPYFNENRRWINESPVNWYIRPKKRMKTDVLSFDNIIDVLKVCSEKHIKSFNLTNGDIERLKSGKTSYRRFNDEKILYYIFRLFGCMRMSEYLRLIEIGGYDIANNEFIDLDRERIVFTNEMVGKGNQTKLRNEYIVREFKPIHPTFMSWLKWAVKYDIQLRPPKGEQKEVELINVCKMENLTKQNILRHTAITYHVQKFGVITNTANVAGTSYKMIEKHYLSLTTKLDDSLNWYDFDVNKAIQMDVLKGYSKLIG
jgi:hypothetical protein